MADSITKFGKSTVNSIKHDFNNLPLVQSINNHEDPISIITRALNRASMISNVTLRSINGQEEMEGYTGSRF